MTSVPLHPQVRARLGQAAPAAPSLAEVPLAEARRRTAALRDLVGPGPAVARVEQLSIPAAHGPIPARRYRPRPGAPRGVVVYLHGGGWVLGAVEDFDAVCRTLALCSGFDVVSVGYRLAPEHPFPAAVDDACAATAWLARPSGVPVVVMGESAGGNLAAVCAQRAAAEGWAASLALQVLAYPITDHDFDTGSYRLHGDGHGVGRAEMMWFWDQYVPDRSCRDDPRASPLRAPDLAGLPPAYVIVAGHDPLRDEGVAYAERMIAAGVQVTVQRCDDMPHGFLPMVDVYDRADEVLLDVAAAIAARAPGGAQT
jgi:acetyl esterase